MLSHRFLPLTTRLQLHARLFFGGFVFGARFPTSGPSQGSTEEFLPGARKRSPLPTKRRSRPFKSRTKRAPSKRTQKKKKFYTLKTPNEPTCNWVIGGICIQFASAFVVLKRNMFPWCSSSIAGRTEVSSLSMKRTYADQLSTKMI